MRLTIRVQALLLSAVPLAAMLAVLVLAVEYSYRTRDTAFWAEHSQAVLNLSARIRAEMRANDRPGAISDSLALVQLVHDNPAQIARAQRIAQAIARRRDPTDDSRAFDAAERVLASQRLATLSQEMRTLGFALSFALATSIALTALALFTFGGRIVARLRRLSENVRRLGNGEDPLPIDGDDEIRELDRQFRDMTQLMRRERAISNELQRALLPNRLPDIPGVRIDATYRPASVDTEIGGDWYDVFDLDNRTIGISIGDVTGHGIQAASTMSAIRQSIQTAAHSSRDVAAVMDLVNRIVYDGRLGVASAAFATLNYHTGEVQYASAGHPAAITLRASGTTGLLQADGLLLGVKRDARYEARTTHLEEGAALVYVTDGAIETERGDYGRGLARLIDAIEAAYYDAANNIAAEIADRVFGSSGPRDDTAILFVGISELGAKAAAREHRWHLDARRVAEARRLKRALLWHLGRHTSDGADLVTVELIFGELLGNVARHTPGDATVILELDGERAVLHVEDRGDAIPDTIAAPDTFAESGRGLSLVRALARDVRITRNAAGNRVSAELPLSWPAY